MSEQSTAPGNRTPIRILGGGLAGLSLGVGLLRRGVAATVEEAGTYPRHRVCGEFLSGLDVRTMEALGIAHLMEGAAVCRQTSWFYRDREVMQRRLPEPAIGISRRRLDARLASEFRRLGGNLCEGLRAVPGGNAGEVIACGRRRARGPWVGLKVHLEGMELAADLEMHLGRDCYLGLAQIEGGVVNACGLFRGVPCSPKNLAEVCRERGLAKLGRRLAAAVESPGSYCSVAGLGFGWQSRFGRANPFPGVSRRAVAESMPLGDHLAVIPPFSGNGMAMALESAELALEPLVDFAAGACSWKDACRLFDRAARKRFRRRLSVAEQLQPMLVAGAGQCLVAGLARLLPGTFPIFYRLLRP